MKLRYEPLLFLTVAAVIADAPAPAAFDPWVFGGGKALAAFLTPQGVGNDVSEDHPDEQQHETIGDLRAYDDAGDGGEGDAEMDFLRVAHWRLDVLRAEAFVNAAVK